MESIEEDLDTAIGMPTGTEMGVKMEKFVRRFVGYAVLFVFFFSTVERLETM